MAEMRNAEHSQIYEYNEITSTIWTSIFKATEMNVGFIFINLVFCRKCIKFEGTCTLFYCYTIFLLNKCLYK